MSRRKQSRPQYFDHDDIHVQYARISEAEDNLHKAEAGSTPEKLLTTEVACYGEDLMRKEMVGCNQTLTESQLDTSLLHSTDSQIKGIPSSAVNERQSNDINSVKHSMAENTHGVLPDSALSTQNSHFFGGDRRSNKTPTYTSGEAQGTCNISKNFTHDVKQEVVDNGVRLHAGMAIESSVNYISATHQKENEKLKNTSSSCQMPDAIGRNDRIFEDNVKKLNNNIPMSKLVEENTRPTSGASGDGESEIQSKFSCIVCAMELPDVATLQRHILSEHVNMGQKEVLRRRSDVEKISHDWNRRSNQRKVSTVSPPQLSLLSTIDARIGDRMPSSTSGAKTSVKNASVVPLVELQRDDKICQLRQKKKRGNGDSCDVPSPSVVHTASEYNRVKKIKKDILDPNEDRDKSEAECSLASRRVSCPSMCRDNAAAASYEDIKIPDILENDRYCAECDINFSSPVNFRAHKQFYCASRHMEKFREVYQLNFDNPQASPDIPQSISLPSRPKPPHKRNIGNRSSMTPRKRSHLIPLQSNRGISSVHDDGAKERKSHLHKSISDESMAVSSSDAYDPNTSATAVPKKHFCEECNIWFSKYDTYIAHKKYYCESRRKDRLVHKSVPPRTQISRRSEPNFRKSPSSVLLNPEERRSSSPESGLSMLAEENPLHHVASIPTSSTDHHSTRDPFAAPFLYFNHAESNILARLSCMHPFVLNHYMSMLQQKMTTEIQGKLDIYANAFRRASLETTTASSENDRKLSVDESRLSMNNTVSHTSLRKANRPNRQSCAAVINIKQEPGTPKEHLLIEQTTSTAEKDVATPLDLRSTTYRKVREGRADDSVVDATTKSEEPALFTAERDALGTETIDKERDQQIKFSAVDDSTPGVQISQEMVSKSKHCRGCDVRFTSLSAFIAHKKYYCTATNSNSVLAGNDTKPAQLAH